MLKSSLPGGHDERKTKAQLMAELAGVRQRVSQLEAAETERQRAEEALHESHQLLERTFASLRDAVFIIDANTTAIMDCNPAAAEIFGYSREDMLGRATGFLHVDQTALEAFRRLSTAVAEKGFLFLSEFKMKRKDGTTFPTEHTVMPLEDEQGRRVGWVSVVRDITERKHAEEALRENESKFRGIVEYSTDGIVLADEQGNIIEWNQSQEWITGLKRAEVVGQPVWEVLFQTLPEEQKIPAVYEHFRASTLEFLRTGQAPWLHQFRETESQRPDGTRRVVQGMMFPIKTDKGFMCGNVTRDITARTRSEEALRESGNRLQSLFETMAEGVILIAPDGQIVQANLAAERILGLSRPEIESRNYIAPDWAILRPDGTPMPAMEMAGPRAMQEKQPIKDMVMGVRRPDGSASWINVCASPLLNSAGDLEGVVGTFADITERTRSEEALRESEERFRRLSDAAFEAIAIHEGGVVLSANDQYLEMFGYEPDELLGKQVILLTVAPEAREFMRKQIATGGSGPYESIGLRKDGTKFPMEIRVREMEYAGRRVRVGAIRDITERKQAEEKLRASRDQLRALAVRLSQVEETDRRALARELHDRVGQNLTALSINLNIIRNQLSGKSAEKVVARLDDSLTLVTETVERTRDVMGELHPPVLDDYGLLAALRWYGDRFSKRTDIATLFEGKELAPRLAPDVESALFRIAQEALTNVAKHTYAKTVTLTLERVDGGAQLIIADDGAGFDPARDAPRGWGMITMRERAESVGGRVRVESAPGKGTRVIVELGG